MNKFEKEFGEWVLKYRAWLIPICLILIFLTFTHGKDFNPTTDYRVFFSDDNPQLLAFEELERTYSKNDNILFVITAKNGNIYTQKALAAANYLSNEERERKLVLKHPDLQSVINSCVENITNEMTEDSIANLFKQKTWDWHHQLCDGELTDYRNKKKVNKWVTKGKAWYIPYSTRVDSITNFRHTKASKDENGEDQLSTFALAPNPSKLTDDQLKAIRKIVETEPSLKNRIASSKGDVMGVNVTIDLPGINDTTEAPEAVTYARKIAKQVEKLYPEVEVRLVGMVMFNNGFSEASMNDVKILYPIALAFIMLFLILLLRSITASIITLLVMFMSIMAGMNIIIGLGTPITPPLMTAPVMILTVAIANSVHILVTFVQQMRFGMTRIDAVKESLRINIMPVFLTSFTTMIGFLTMNFSDIPPFRHLGNTVAIGVMISFFLSILFLPAVISYLPIKFKHKADTGNTFIDRLASFVINRRRPLMWGMLIVIVTLVSFVPKNELNDNFLKYFDKTIQIRNDMDYTTRNLTGLYQIEYSVDSGKKSDGAKNPAFLADTEKFVAWLNSPWKTEELFPFVVNMEPDARANFDLLFKLLYPDKKVTHTFTFLDTLKRVNSSLHNDNAAWYKLPDSKNQAADYIMLYENSVPSGFDPRNQIDIAMTATRVTANLKTMTTNSMIAFEARVQDWLTKNTTTIKKAEGTGPTMIFSHTSRRNIISMLTGTSIALVLISLILIIAFRSVKIGLISMVPNLIPAAMGFGLWAIFDGQVGLALSIVTGMTLGIVVDDTVHFLSKYLRARRELNASASSAVRYAFHNVGYALITTSTVLTAGFIVLAYSSFKLNADMGLLTAIVIVFALIADFLFLPTLLMLLEGKKNEKTSVNTLDANTRSTS